MNQSDFVYRSSEMPEFFLRNATEQDDARLLELISETMPSNGMVLSFERYPRYFDATKTQYTAPDIKLVCAENDPNHILAMINLGRKRCFINLEICDIPYVADLRLDPKYRGKKALNFIMSYVYSHFSTASFFQSIVLEDNVIAKHILHQPRADFPIPYLYDDIATYTISKIKIPKNHNQFEIKTLQRALVPKVNEFVHSMKQYFNFLPVYDFNELEKGNHPYWLGLKLEDFKLVYKQGELVGLFGLWNQKQFKQTTVKTYSKSLKMIRPFYNFFAKKTGKILLPKENDHFNYLMIHSPLCNPHHADVFEQILYHAHVQTKTKSTSSFCITLALDDPRTKQMQNIRSHIIRAKHALHSFESKPDQYFDRNKISYFEVGRI